MRLPQLALDNRPFTLVVALLLVVMGAISFRSMPRSEDPQFDISASRIVAVYPGASPEDLESLVVDPLEAKLNEIEDIKKLETSIQDGVALTTVEFEAFTDAEETFDAVTQAIAEVRPTLPEGLAALELIKTSPTDATIFQVALVSATASTLTLKREAERLEDAFERVRAVQRADVWAVAQPEVRVGVDLETLHALGLPLGRVMQAITSSAQNLPGGSVDAGRRRYTVQTSGDYASLDDVRRTIVYGDGERLVFLRDIADVDLAYADDVHRARYRGERAVFVTAIQREGSNIFELRDALGAQLDGFKVGLPDDVRAEVVFDQSVAVADRVGGFFTNLLQGMLLVGLVVLLALGARAATVVLVAIPVAILIAINWLDLTDFGLQQISIVGLVIALGLLVDNAIVVVENVARYRKRGLGAKEAAAQGTSEVGYAVLSATATSVLAFVPIMSIQSGAGDFIRSMPLTVVYALVASLLISLTLTPLLASRLLRRSAGREAAKRKPARSALGEGPLQRVFARVADGPYRRLLGRALRRPAVVLGVAALALAGSVALFPLIGVSLFPKAEKPQFLINIETPEGASLDYTDEVTQRVERYLAAQPAVVRYAANVGRGNPRVYYNVYPRRERPTVAQLLVELADARQVEAFAQQLGRALQMPGVELTFDIFENGPPVEAPIAIKTIGPDLRVLERIAADVERVVRATPGIVNADNPLAEPKTDLHVRIDRDKAGLFGVPLAEVDQTVLAALSGLPVGTYRDDAGDDYPIVVRLPLGEAEAGPEGATRRPTLSDFDRISVTSAAGQGVPLRQIATLELRREPTRIDHFGLERAVTVTADVATAEGYNEIAVTQEVMDALAGYPLPPGYRFFVGGKLEAQQENFQSLGGALLLALLAIFAVLVLQFRSLRQPLIIFAAIPLSVVGAFPALLLTGYTFSFMAFIGFTSLVGIVVNNSILLVDFANRLRRAGRSVRDAVQEAGRTRFAPILLTTLTTIGGLLPLALTRSDLWSPLSWVIIGGLAVSTLLTLVVVPVLYLLLTREEAVA